MIRYQVGVRHESVAIAKIDLDFWEDD